MKTRNYKLSKLSSGVRLVIQDSIYTLRSKNIPTKEIIQKVKNDFDINLNKSEVKSLYKEKSFNEFDQMLSTRNLYY